MISAQDLIEKILNKANCDDCIVIIKEKSQANLRWANSTLTTNGVIQERNVTILAFVALGSEMAVGGVSKTNIEENEIDDLLAEAIAAAKAAGAADDYAPLAKNLTIGDWHSEHIPTGPEVFKKFAPDLGEMLKKSVSDEIELFGYAEHTNSTTWLGSKGGLRLRNDSPIGRVEMTGKSHQRSRSTWEGVETHDFKDVSIPKIDGAIRERLAWQAKRIDLPAGRYDAVLPSGAVADLYTYMIWVSGARDTWEGQTVFSKKGGGTRVGEKLANVPINLYSDPKSKLLPGSPFVSHSISSSLGSVFDNGQPSVKVDWLKDGVLQSLIQTRASAKLTSLPFTPIGDNFFMEIPSASGNLADQISGLNDGLLLTTLWYIRMVDPNSLLLTGLTRDGVYYVKNGEVQGATNNFRWNDSPVSALSRIKSASASEWTQPREWAEYATHLHMPALTISDFNMSTVSPGN
jgi:predicted Zn-dependent protease